MTIRRRWRKASVALIAGALVTTAMSGSASAKPTSEPVPVLDTVSEALAPDSIPLMSEELFKLQQEVFRQFGASANFGISTISPNQDALTFRWYGSVPRELSSLINQGRGAAGLDLQIAPTRYSPGELRAEASRLVSESAGAGPVVAASPTTAGDGIQVYVTPAATDGVASPSEKRIPSRVGERVPAEVLSRMGLSSRFPLSGEIREAVVPATGTTRYDDYAPHWAGSRIAYRVSSTSLQTCSSSWPVGKVDGTRGMLTAAHCGPLQQEWWARNFVNNANGAFSFGSVTQEYAARDAAVMTGSSHQNVVYTGAPTLSTEAATSVTAYATGVSGGQYVCFSGAASKANCGSVVTNREYYYTLASVSGTILGFETTRYVDQTSVPPQLAPAGGNGDSGGPNFLLYQCAPGICPAALGIYSAMPGNGAGDLGYCEGEPATTTRRCSAIAISTVAYEAATAMGWSLLG